MQLDEGAYNRKEEGGRRAGGEVTLWILPLDCKVVLSVIVWDTISMLLKLLGTLGNAVYILQAEIYKLSI